MEKNKQSKFEKQAEMLRYNLIRRKRQLEERKKIEETVKEKSREENFKQEK